MTSTHPLGPLASAALATPLGGLLGRLPRDGARAAGAALGEVGRWTDPRGRRRGHASLAAALPSLDGPGRAALLRRAYRHQGRLAADDLRLDRAGPIELCRRLALEGWPELQRALSEPTPALICISPLGAPAAARRALALYLRPAGWLAREPRRPRRPALSGRSRSDSPDGVVAVASSAALEWLARRPLAPPLVCDLEPDEDGPRTPFFDGEIGLLARPATLCSESGAALWIAEATWLPDGRVRLAVEPSVESGQPRPAVRPAVPAALGAALAGIEERARRHPEQWPWMAPGWRVR